MASTFIRSAAVVAAVAATLGLTACVDPYYYNRGYDNRGYPPPAPVSQAPVYDNGGAYAEYGRVANIETFSTENGRRPSGAGAIIGAVLGAVVGNQIGHGGGRALATGVGAVGGAVAGNQIEGNQRGGGYTTTYRISVQLDNGGYRAFDVPSPGDLRQGDRVRVVGNQLQRV
ncbi:glycine zipper 2TM domain-containing protein [Xylophilus sp.]|uniref:glycine zipper 2TM domain-containing protein n=1 Tax=Xylophilus sp. TaxID=2653893 RepID=UPI0013B8FB95|nr:glycine zipper 2TM domain-containing protein [Xylophilus sp.]KAF1048084.1 MAG: hypothetical protein GAK38_01555 [Xylophilus sp.]